MRAVRVHELGGPLATSSGTMITKADLITSEVV